MENKEELELLLRKAYAQGFYDSWIKESSCQFSDDQQESENASSSEEDFWKSRRRLLVDKLCEIIM